MWKTEEPGTIPKGFRLLLDNDEGAEPKIVMSHKLEFRASQPGNGRRSVALPWSASMIEDVRRKAKIPDEANISVTTSRVVFTWETEWTETAKPERKKGLA